MKKKIFKLYYCSYILIIFIICSCNQNCDKTIVIIKETIIKNKNVCLNDEILPCPICGSNGYIHRAVNDTTSWTVDCTVYDKKGYEHKRVGNKWQNSKSEAIRIWNNSR